MDASNTRKRVADKLTATEVRNQRTPGKYGDGKGLWLVVTTPERRSWLFRFMLRGKAREMSLGSLEHVSLAQARDKAAEARRLLAQNIDPLDQRHEAQAAEVKQESALPTFKEAAEAFIATNEAGWRNPKHRQQWRNTLATYAYPAIGTLPAADVGRPEVLKVLEPIWKAKPETASRVRGRIESVLDFARFKGWRGDGPNPATWRGNLEYALPARRKVKAVVHHAALDWRAIPAFMAKLREREGIAARALEFAIVTAARSGEVRLAVPAEVDERQALWTVPGERMKAGKTHRVPLSEAALSVVRAAQTARNDDMPSLFLFPGAQPKRPLSDMSLTAVLRRMGHGDVTAHGFRSSFKDWASESGYPDDISEAALAHMRGDKTVSAYQRGELLDRRRKLMDAWATYCAGTPATSDADPAG